MPQKYFTNLVNAVRGKTTTQSMNNAFNQAFIEMGSRTTHYDPQGSTYVNKGYNANAVVYSIVSQAATKVASVPSFLKKEEDKKAKRLHANLINKQLLSAPELAQKRILERKAYSESEIAEPLERPNYYQSWEEFYALWETFMLLNGNAYMWIMSPEDGMNARQPMQVFLLPAQYTQIVLKTNYQENLNSVNSLESPIDHFIMTIGNKYIQFKAQDVIHTKFPNPNYDLNGSHLYGQSPLRAALSDLQVANEATNQNIKTMQNGGVFGFIHGTDAARPLMPEQAQALKDRLVDMGKDTGFLNRYAGSAEPLGFTKLSLNTDELKPFEFLDYSLKQFCNIYGWNEHLLNADAKYDNITAGWRMAISNRVQPDLCILQNALNDEFYPRFKNMQGVVKVFDVSELPEMQADMEKLTQWLKEAFDRGIISPDEYRSALRYPEVGDELMQTRFIKQGYIPLSDVLLQDNPLDDPQSLKL